MKSHNTRLLGSLVGALLALSCGGNEQPSSIPTRFKPLADAVEAERIALGVPGVAIAIVEHGEVAFSHGFGRKDARGTASVEPTTLFRIGSTTKPLTTVAVLQVVQQGLVSLDDPVQKSIPDFHLAKSPDAVPNIHLRHLLNQTSGLPDLAFATGTTPEERTDGALESYFTSAFAENGYAGAPAGAVWAYANANFGLAGLIAEKATGLPYRVLIRDRVLSPLMMDRTVFLPSDVVADGDYAVGLNCPPRTAGGCNGDSGNVVIEPDTYDYAWVRPSGMAWSSVLDLARFARFVLYGDESVLSPELHRAMTSAQVSTKSLGDIHSYGFGLFVWSGVGAGTSFGYHPLKVIEHGGDVAGFSSTFKCAPALDICFIALANASGAHFDQSAFTALQTLVELPGSSEPPDIAPKLERYPAYAGTYSEPTLGIVTIGMNADKLTIQIPSLDANGTPYASELVPTGIDSFASPIQGSAEELVFVADANGTYQYIRSRPYIASRVVSQQATDQ